MQSTTKSGTNEFHGSAFNFLRNDKLNAGNFYTHTRPIVRRNQYGGTIGGPIIKNKTFFFFDMQFTKQRGTSAFNNLTVPSPAFREGDFSSLVVNNSPVTIYDPATTTGPNNQRQPFPGNRIPAARISPAAQECPGAVSAAADQFQFRELHQLRLGAGRQLRIRHQDRSQLLRQRQVLRALFGTQDGLDAGQRLSRIPTREAAIRGSSDSAPTRITAVRRW